MEQFPTKPFEKIESDALHNFERPIEGDPKEVSAEVLSNTVISPSEVEASLEDHLSKTPEVESVSKLTNIEHAENLKMVLLAAIKETTERALTELANTRKRERFTEDH